MPRTAQTSHFPIYLSSTGLEATRASADWYLSDEAEDVAVGSGGELRSCGANGEPEDCRTVAALREQHSSVLEPLFVKYGVDM